MTKGRIFMLDNQDSFAYNLVDELAQLGFALEIYRNQVEAEFIYQKMLQASAHERVLLCLSPGPGHPTEAGCLLQLIALCKGHFPILGICLGLQALIHQAGGSVGRCAQVMHGKTSRMQVTPHPIFQNPTIGQAAPETNPTPTTNTLQVARYHSLQALTIAPGTEVIAEVEGIPMVTYDATNATLGFQFHPESILTTYGSQLLYNTIEYLLNQGESL